METLEIRAIEVTSNSIGDAPVLPDLLAQIPSNEMLVSVVGDGAYDTKGCYAAIASRDAEAIIPVRKNGKHWKENTVGASTRNKCITNNEAPRARHLEEMERLPSA